MEEWVTEDIEPRQSNDVYWDVDNPSHSTLFRKPFESPYSDIVQRSNSPVRNNDETTDYENVHDIRDVFIDDDVEHWKRILLSVIASSMSFLISIAGAIGFAFGQNTVYLYVSGLFAVLFFIFRVGAVYYLYLDASYVKRITVDFRKHVQRDFVGGWRPSTFFWAVTTLLAPPFVVYAPVVVYLFRRHRRVGVP